MGLFLSGGKSENLNLPTVMGSLTAQARKVTIHPERKVTFQLSVGGGFQKNSPSWGNGAI